MKNFKDKINIFKRAQKEEWALGAFNISNMEALRAIFNAAKKLNSPVIIATSEGESKYIGLKQAVTLVRDFEEEFGIPAILNLDHGKSFDYIKEAISAGYDSVHFDGSKMPLEENIRIAKEIRNFAHKKEVLIEGEVGFIKGSSKLLDVAPEIIQEDLTDPNDALRFIKETEVDSLAINVGTFHGMEVSGQKEHINIARLKEIKNKLGDKVFLVLHGGSGVPAQEIRDAIKNGIVKININTELRLAFADTLGKIFKEGLKESAPYKYMPEVVEAVQKVVEEKIILFNSNNKI